MEEPTKTQTTTAQSASPQLSLITEASPTETSALAQPTDQSLAHHLVVVATSAFLSLQSSRTWLWEDIGHKQDKAPILSRQCHSHAVPQSHATLDQSMSMVASLTPIFSEKYNL